MRPFDPEPDPDDVRDRAVAALQALVRFPTVSSRDPAEVDVAAFDGLLDDLARRFPLLHKQVALTRIGTHGLLFHWRGRSAERPVVLMAHTDVVPVDTSATWQHPPFGAVVADGSVWGRGTLDDKGCVVAICLAVERLLEREHVPAQDVWLSFGCDEEVSGQAAPLAVAELQRRGVRPWFVLDEGGAVASGAFPGVRPPLAVVGVTEKGVTSLRLIVEGRGGHASTPAPMGPTARIARAVLRLEAAPLPPQTPAVTLELLERLAPHVPFVLRGVLTRASRLGPALTRVLLRAGPEASAMVRTTIAVTQLSGSPGLNVLASRATAGVSIRVMVGDTVAGVLEHVRRALRDPQVRVEVVESNEPSPVSPWEDDAFRLLEATIGEVFPDAVPTPYVMMAATDARFFTGLCERVYRYAPFRMTRAQRQSIHSYDEHLGVEALVDGVRWYERLVERLPS